MEHEPNDPVHRWTQPSGTRANEIWFALFTDPAESLAFWYHIELISTGSENVGRAWAAVMDTDTGEESFAAQEFDVSTVELARRPFSVTTDDHQLTSSSLSGTIRGNSTLEWSLEWEPDTYAFTPIHADTISKLFSNTIGTGQYWSRNQSILVDGTVTIDGQTSTPAGAPGMQGHIVLPTFQTELTWVHCNTFDTSAFAADQVDADQVDADQVDADQVDADHVAFEALQMDRFLTAVLRIDNEIFEFNRLHHLLPVGPKSNTVKHNEVGEWQCKCNNGEVDVRASLRVETDCWHRVAQYHPRDRYQYVAHSPVATLTLTYAIDGADWTTVSSPYARVEWHNDSPPIGGTFKPLRDE